MPSSTSVFDRFFLIFTLFFCLVIAAALYFFIEKNAEELTKRKKDDRYQSFVESQNTRQIGMILLGTSHTESVTIPLEVNTVAYLSAAHTIPPVMYIKAKLITRIHPEVKAVYLEADDHLFFNGSAYNMDGMDPVAKRKSNVYRLGSAFIDRDNEATAIFGEVAPYSANPFLLLSDDVKPIVIKRIVNNLFRKNVTSNDILSIAAGTEHSCNPAFYGDSHIDLTHDTDWSRRSPTDKKFRIQGVMAEHNLHLPGPLDKRMLEYYEKTIQLLKKHHIDVVLVQYPETHDFVASKNPIGQKLYEEFIKSLVTKYALHKLDLRYLSDMGDNFFADQDHVYSAYEKNSPSNTIGKLIMQDYCFSQTGKTL